MQLQIYLISKQPDYHNSILKMKAPTETLGKVYIVNTVSDNPKKWFLL